MKNFDIAEFRKFREGFSNQFFSDVAKRCDEFAEGREPIKGEWKGTVFTAYNREGEAVYTYDFTETALDMAFIAGRMTAAKEAGIDLLLNREEKINGKKNKENG